jgi:vacuolar-type H+-ATPase subunit I/STV1
VLPASQYKTPTGHRRTIAGTIPLQKTIQEATNIYRTTHNSQDYDKPIEVSYWPHPAEIVNIKESDKEQEYPIEVHTDGSKSDKGVGCGAVIFRNGEIIKKLKHKLHNRCSNNQAEQLAIQKALEEIHQLTQIENKLHTYIYTFHGSIILSQDKRMWNKS